MELDDAPKGFFATKNQKVEAPPEPESQTVPSLDQPEGDQKMEDQESNDNKGRKAENEEAKAATIDTHVEREAEANPSSKGPQSVYILNLPWVRLLGGSEGAH
jgi:hypothetical protein